jgi:hypothetical protein
MTTTSDLAAERAFARIVAGSIAANPSAVGTHKRTNGRSITKARSALFGALVLAAALLGVIGFQSGPARPAPSSPQPVASVNLTAASESVPNEFAPIVPGNGAKSAASPAPGGVAPLGAVTISGQLVDS